MVRAATTGVIDFTQFDPWDLWWWKRTQWALDELETQLQGEVAKVQHAHWVTLASHGRLEPASFETTMLNARQALDEYMTAMYPWLADTIAGNAAQNSNEALMTQYREEFGSPGEPRYEAMIAGLKSVFRKGKLSSVERDRFLKNLRNKREAE